MKNKVHVYKSLISIVVGGLLLLFSGTTYSIPPAPFTGGTVPNPTTFEAAVGVGKSDGSGGANLNIYATLGTELLTWTDATWNDDDATWTMTTTGPLVHVTGNTTAVTATLTAATVVGTTYKVVITGTGGGDTATYILGGQTGTTIPASGAIAITDYITATAISASLVITPASTCTASLTLVSVKALTDATGDLTVDGNLTVRSPFSFLGGGTVTGATTFQNNSTTFGDGTGPTDLTFSITGADPKLKVYPNANISLGATNMGSLSTGVWNIAIGGSALEVISTGSRNVAIGINALNNFNGDENVAIGSYALGGNASGEKNTAIGYSALNVATGGHNTGIGHSALLASSTGEYNTAVGSNSMSGNLGGNNNTAIGEYSLFGNTSGSANVAIGLDALYQNTTGSNNTAFGAYSLAAQTVGINNNIGLGNFAGRYETAGNKLFIDSLDRIDEATGRTNSFIYGVMNTTVANQTVAFNVGSAKLPASAYFNFGTTHGTSGYGLRDNGTIIEQKHSGGSWFSIATPITLGQILKADGTNWTASSTLAISEFDMTSGTKAIPWTVSASAGAQTIAGQAHYDSALHTLSIGDSVGRNSFILTPEKAYTFPTVDASLAPLVSPSFTTPALGAATGTSLALSSILTSKMPVVYKTSPYTASATEVSGYMVMVTTTHGILPAAVVGDYIAIMADTALIHQIDVNGADKVKLVGSTTAVGTGIKNSSNTAGDYIILVCNTTSTWDGRWGKQGTWVSQ